MPICEAPSAVSAQPLPEAITSVSLSVALVEGKPLTEWPADLFIPPDALTVLLDLFSGPLDLLLYLIRRQNLDILNIPMRSITQQYMQYIELMQVHQLDLAAEYLLMAATLAEIKSRMLLPRPVLEEGQEECDPRMDLVRRLQAYEAMKVAAESLAQLPRQERDIFPLNIVQQSTEPLTLFPDVELAALAEAIRRLHQRQVQQSQHYIKAERFSVRERMQLILERIAREHSFNIFSLWNRQDGRGGFIACFLAVLELAKLSLIHIHQAEPLACIELHRVDA
ncbi:MAG: segregation/condensation protein A [Legionellaceae bacterium]|nr:segregation/condensation protein A [Legionellaceae bacterium]